MSKELEQRVLDQTRELTAANEALRKETIERRRAEEALRLSEEQFRGAFDHAPIGMALLRPDGRWLTANPAFYRMLGYAEPELLEETFQSILHPEDLEAHLKGARQLLAGQINLFAVEERLFHKDGRIIWTHASVTVVRAAEGDPLYFVAQIQDISGSKRIQEALRESEERFRQLAENITEVFWMTNPDKNEILYVSPGYEKIWGRPRRSLCERPSEWLDAIHPDDRERIQNSAMTLQASGAYDEEYRIIRPDGSTRWIRDRAFPIKDTSGRVYRITGIAEDITERRQAEERIRFQANLLDVVEQAVIATDIAGVILYWNRFAEKLYGWSTGEVLGRNIMEITLSDLSLDQAGEIMNLLARGEGWSGEFLVRRRDGASFMAMVIDTPIRDDQGKLIGIIGVSFDVSERKRAEIERDHHAAQLQGLADASLAMNSAISLDETLKIVTDKTREIIGAHMSVTGMTINGKWEQAISAVSFSDKYEAFRHYDERPDGSGIYAMVCQANRPLRMTQAELEAHPRWRGYGKHAGAHPPLRGWLAAPLVGRDGKNIGLIQLSDKYEGEFTQQDEAILVQMAQLASNAIENARLYETLEKDIQNRKRTEERLREYEKAVEGLEEMIIVVDRDYRYLIANRAFLNYRGMEKEQLIGRFAPDLLGREVFEKIVKKKLDACFRGEVVKYEMNFSYPKLGERVLSLSYFPIEGPAGIDRVACVMQDITERKQAEEALRTSEERFRRYFELGLIGMAITSLEKGWIEVNDEICRILGYERRELLEMTWTEVTHPDDLDADFSHFNRMLSGEIDGYSMEKRFIRKDGQVIHAAISVKCLRRPDGSIDYMVGLLQDITERMQAEARLAYQANLLTHVGDAILATDHRLVLTAWNLAAERIYGWKAEEVLGRRVSDVIRSEWTDAQRSEALDVLIKTGTYHTEVIHTHKDGRKIDIQGYTIALRDEAGRITGYVSTNRDITERKRADEALRQSEEKYRTLFETMAQGVIYQDAAGKIVAANPAAERILGLTLDQLQGRTSFDPRWRAIREDGSDFPGKNHPAMVALRTGEAVIEVVIGVFHPKTETYRWISVNAVPQFRAGEDKPYQVYTVFSDITERKKAEETIRAAKEFSENLIQTANVMILSLDTEGRIDIFNKAAEKITGYTLSELKGKNWFETLVPRDRYPSVWEYFTQVVEGGMPKAFENPILTKTGEERYILWQNNQVKVDGKVVATISFGNDITERKKAEEALRAEHAFREAIEEAMPAGVMVVDSTGRQTYVNQSFCEMVGWSAEELNGAAPPFIFWPPEQIDRIKESFERHTRGRVKAGPVELIFRRRNEERFPVSLLVSSLVDHQGEPVGYLASVHDMSVLKTSQEKLERRERQLLQAQRLAHLGSWSWDLVSDTVTWSDELYPIFGVVPERFTPTYEGVVHLIHPDDRERFKQANRTALRGGRSFEVSFRVIRTEGAVRILHASGMVSLDPTGRPVSIVGVVQDITDIKQAEETLRESEERYRSLIANIPDAAWRVREDGQPIFISRNIEKIIGYTSEEICSGGFTLTFGRIHPEDRERVARAFKSLFSKNQKFDVEYRVQRKNGEWIWIHDRAVMTYQREGIRYADGIVSDITERKKSEEAVRKSEERFHLIARATNDAVWDWDLPTNTVWWNESFKTLFGYNEIEPGVESWSKRIHPEDKERVLAGTHAVVERGGQFWSAEYRFLRADGSYATILDRGYVVHVKDGKATRMIGAMMDITERKRAEDALTEYAKRLRSLSGQLLEAQETERRRIARELHDEIGQSLTAIKLQLHGSKRLSDRRMEECIQMVDQTLSQVRNLSLDLHPPELDELGLVATLRWHLDRQAHAANLISNFSADPLPARLPPDLEIACFRVAQEALTNVIRHAHAGEVSIELRQRENELHLTVEDDGEGFDVGAARSRAIQGTSLGLVGMQERAELAGGRLELDSAPGEGTQVRAIFQLADTAPKKQSKRRKR
ncbi:PAS domain S-box protein [Candidatus Manganitrophus noduliformans]|uniref:histidine kinase n=1 Tax=Candidatus Manganitrophus noduliformans TaxID=2606439 RepID=A0A7X6DU14_9BACT|nr:PAS domain S-box protein [Candidatus Manganitrophus noduliformans]NKE73397.1 PAS domain S-box protein [Candidatus Manganitrophus noduliformans]